MGLSNYELVLLDNLICLKKVFSYFNGERNERTIGATGNKFLKDEKYIYKNIKTIINF